VFTKPQIGNCGLHYKVQNYSFFPSLFFFSLRLNFKWSLWKFQDNVREKPVSMAMVASQWITLSYYCTIKIQDECPNCVHGNLADVFYLGSRILVLQIETAFSPKIFCNVWSLWTTFWPFISLQIPLALYLCHESPGWQPNVSHIQHEFHL